jgi:hypothetical protein
MGRPLNKKYFGNRNIGGSGTGDDYGIGGEGVESISVATAGSFSVSNTYKNFPLLNIGAPNLPTGVQATADVVFEINTVAFSSGGQTNADYVNGLSTSITGLGGGAVVRIVETANKVTSVDLTGGNRGEFRRGDAFDGTGITTFQVLQAPNVGTDLQIAITFRVKSITMLEKGSGYTSVPALSWSGHTFTGQTIPSGNTPALTTTPVNPITGSSTYQENAIQLTAYIPLESQAGWVSGFSGSSAVAGDIVRQSGNSKFIARTAQGVGRVKLVGYLGSNVSPAAGEAIITASDYDGGLYYVTKISDRRCNIIGYNGSGFTTGATGINVPWTFNGTSGDKIDANQPYLESGVNVKINNA